MVLSVTSQTFVRSSATRLEVHESTATNAVSVRRSHPLRVSRSRRVHAARTAKRESSSSRETEEKLSLRMKEAYENVVSLFSRTWRRLKRVFGREKCGLSQRSSTE